MPDINQVLCLLLFSGASREEILEMHPEADLSAAREWARKKLGLLSFDQGMACAAGIVADFSDVWAREILNAAGLTTQAELREAEIDEYDLEKFAAAGIVLPETREKAKKA